MSGRPVILVVDDEPRNRALLRGLLSAQHEVLEAKSGPEALEIAGAGRVDLVLLDVMMPGMDGFTACRAIKALQGEALLPVLLVTALGEQEDKNRGLEAGADDFLHKPVDRRELLLRVRSFLQLRAQDATIRAQVLELRRMQAQQEELASMLVHDLRNPLSATLASIDSALFAAASDEQRKDLLRAQGSAEKLLASLDELLQVRLLENAAIVACRATVELAGLAQGCVETLLPVAERRRITLTQSAAGSAALDEKLVRRSIENLLSNALKYTPAGASVHLAIASDAGGTNIEVSDRGPGIPDAFKGTLFSRFGSVEAQQGNQRRGVGLGLYLVKLVAEAHGGEVSAVDRDGGGTTFRMRLAA